MKELSRIAVKVKESSTLSIAAKAKKMKADGIDVVGFGVGEPDFNTPDNINKAAIEAINTGFTRYTPASGIEELRKAICKKLKDENGLVYQPSQIIVSNGAKHSLTNAFTALLNPGDEVIIPAPYWLSYVEIINIAGGVPVVVDTDERTSYKVTAEMLEKALSPKTKILLINSPSNPTGMIYSEEELRQIADFAVRNDLYVVSDEIYECLIYDENQKHVSIASFNDEIFKRTVVINGVSKKYAMTGWRIGYSASSSEIASVVANVQSHQTSNPNSIAQKAALEALMGEQESVKKMVAEFKKRRDYIYDRVKNIPHFKAVRPDGAFYVFIDISELIGKTVKNIEIKNAADVADLLLQEASVAIVPAADFGCPNHIRLSYAISMDDIKKGMDRIEEFIKSI